MIYAQQIIQLSHLFGPAAETDYVRWQLPRHRQAGTDPPRNALLGNGQIGPVGTFSLQAIIA